MVSHKEFDISSLNIVGRRLEDAKSTKNLNESGGIFKENQSQRTMEDFIQKHKEFEEKHVVKKLSYSGGFKIPEENFINPLAKKKQPKAVVNSSNENGKVFDDSRNTAGVSK